MSFRFMRPILHAADLRKLKILLLATVVVSPLIAARLKPPSEALREQQNQVIVAEVLEILEDGRAVFKRRVSLHGESVARVEARVPAEELESLSGGDVLIVGYSTLQRSPRTYKGWEPDPEGARVVQVPTVGAALFESSDPMRLLASDREGEKSLSDRQLLDAIVAQARRSHVQSRRFVLSELALRPRLLDGMDDKDLGTLRAVLQSETLEPMAKDYLIRALLPLAQDQRVRSWLSSSCRQVLKTWDTNLDLASPVPALVEIAARGLGAAGNATDLALLGWHLSSNNPGVARESWRAMLRLDPAAARTAGRKVLDRPGLHPDTRLVIERDLERTPVAGE